MQVLQRALHALAQLVEAVVLDEQPEEVLVLEALLVLEAVVGEVLVDERAVLRVRVEALLALRLRALAGGADVHHRQLGPGLLRERERPCVQRVGELLVVLGDDAGAAAGRAVELDELEVQQRCDVLHRAVQLGRETAADAAGPVGDLHRVVASVLGGRLRLARGLGVVLVVAADVQVQLVALAAALDLLEDPLDLLRSSLGSFGGMIAFLGVTLPRSRALAITGSELTSSAPAAGGTCRRRVAAIGARQQLGLPQQAVVLLTSVTNAVSWRSPLLRSTMWWSSRRRCGAGA